MIIKKAAIGNSEEAFIESSFSERMNIISSDDNNRGKTILIQSALYALGNEPTFPSSFDYKNYYHYVEFEENDTVYAICRRNNGFVLKYGTILMIFDNVSELKRYWNKHIFKLPSVIKNQIPKIVDPVLFFQLVFVGQDKKDTSNIAHAGLYNKQDFYNMLFDYCDAGCMMIDDIGIEQLKEELQGLKDEKNLLLKQHKILKAKKAPLSYVSSENDRRAFEEKLASMEKIRSKIEELRKERNRAATRKARWDTTLKELRSLNRTIDGGELRCMDCDSTNIAFSTSKKSGYAFDVSTVQMRSEIIDSITDQSQAYAEEIERISAEIEKAQGELQQLMEDDCVSLEAIVAFKDEIFDAADAEKRIKEVNANIERLSTQLKVSTDNEQAKKNKQSTIISQITDKMNETYHKIDPLGNLSFSGIFTRKDEVYSGSEATVYHLVKLYALRSVLKHNLPIIIDSFRAEDLSTQKEAIVLGLYGEFDNQIIFTTTLKQEEVGKYDTMKNIRHIDYTNHAPSKMLNPSYCVEFKKLLNNLSLSF